MGQVPGMTVPQPRAPCIRLLRAASLDLGPCTLDGTHSPPSPQDLSPLSRSSARPLQLRPEICWRPPVSQAYLFCPCRWVGLLPLAPPRSSALHPLPLACPCRGSRGRCAGGWRAERPQTPRACFLLPLEEGRGAPQGAEGTERAARGPSAGRWLAGPGSGTAGPAGREGVGPRALPSPAP